MKIKILELVVFALISIVLKFILDYKVLTSEQLLIMGLALVISRMIVNEITKE